MYKRGFLRLLGVGSLGATAGCTRLLGGQPESTGPDQPTTHRPATTVGPETVTRLPETATRSSTPTAYPYADQFETVVDLVEAGADPDGTRSIVSLLEDHLADDTMVYLPAGRYLMDGGIRRTAFQNLGIVGDSAVIAPPDGFDHVYFDLGRPGEASGLLFEGLTFDFHAAETGSRPLGAHVDDELVVRDLAVTGRQDAGWGTLRVDVTSPDGVGLVERLHLPDGATAGTNSNGCLVGDMHRGEVWFEDCHIERFPDNGLYGSPLDGTVHVRGGYYANCGISNLRIGGGSTIRGAHVRCDEAPMGFENMRGIRLRRGTDVEVNDCLIEMLNVTGSDGGITLASELESATIRDTDIRVDADTINGIRIKEPEDYVSKDRPILLENVTITGTASGGSAVDVNGRQNCEFDSITIDQTGEDRDGITFSNGSQGVVSDTDISVSGRPLVVSNTSSVDVVDIPVAGETDG